jgi:hypothetical protein
VRRELGASGWAEQQAESRGRKGPGVGAGPCQEKASGTRGGGGGGLAGPRKGNQPRREGVLSILYFLFPI